MKEQEIDLESTKTESSNPNPRSEKQKANGRKDLPVGPTLPLTPPALSGTGSAAVRVTDRSRRSPSTHRRSERGSGRRGETARRRRALPGGEHARRRGDSQRRPASPLTAMAGLSGSRSWKD
jgi:hypothetical protein